MFPINGEKLSGEARLLLSLPVRVGPNRSYQIHAVVALAADQEAGVHVPEIHQMLLGQQLPSGQGRMDDRRRIPIGDRREGGRHIRDQVGCVGLAGLRQMDLVADPG